MVLVTAPQIRACCLAARSVRAKDAPPTAASRMVAKAVGMNQANAVIVVSIVRKLLDRKTFRAGWVLIERAVVLNAGIATVHRPQPAMSEGSA